MQLKTTAILLALLCVLVADADAQKWEFSAFGGYRWGGELSDGSYNDDLLSTRDLQFENGPSWGLTAGYNITPRFEIELLYDRQYTSFKFVNERLGVDESLGEGRVDYLMAGLSINLLPPDYKLMPYFAFYLGATHILPHDTNLESNWFSAAGYALGVTYFFTEHVGAMVENRGTSTIITDSASLFCDHENERCIVLPRDTWMWQIGLSAGVVFTF